jgi:hypothetical protein
MPTKKSEQQTNPCQVLEYLRNASPSMLQAFELSRLNHVSNMRKELQGLIDQIVTEMSEAALARTLLDHRKELRHPKRPELTTDDLLSEITAESKLLTVGKKAK